ncbi:MAG: hypothetical protein A2Y62_11185 [Candidatus Fischerbacteria bacterium RBG_13_37_8]|uniref:Glycyl-radical enzyme activating protein n=1 Tax=Candidatus Fischerbacteria bacterium RBG_13_37_8 TaxID=1817863 RepID=A0A1F5VWD0_9BACT|nr:MAG: hypothetical protein A2Y62_11185 [Candidatus Fischerbacteria bacterium RBG_13_37_8]
MTKGIIFDIKRYAIHDGPGIRTTVFFKGCPLSCYWCHNPEGQRAQPELVYNRAVCLRCGECVRHCAADFLLQNERGHIVLPVKECPECGECAKVCPSQALEYIGKLMSVEEVMSEVDKDRLFYEESGGGVTFSGGEPFAQPEFLEELLIRCRAKKYHTTVDTCGYVPGVVLARIAPLVDLFLFDIKIMNTEVHRKYMGRANWGILENMKRLAKAGKTIMIRIPVIPGITDTEQNLNDMIAFLKKLSDIHEVALLPFHAAGEAKYKKLRRRKPVRNIMPPSEAKMNDLRRLFENNGFSVKIGG